MAFGSRRIRAAALAIAAAAAASAAAASTVLIEGDARQGDARQRDGVARRLPPVTLDFTVPPIGNAGAIVGTVTGLPAGGAYRACLYKQSRSETYDAGATDFAAVGADGAFTFPAWAQSPWWDLVSPRLWIYVVPTAAGCEAVSGLPAVPPVMETRAVASGVRTRALTLSVAITEAPVAGTPGAVTARVTGLPSPAGLYAATLWVVSGDTGLLYGPAPACGPAAATGLVPVPGDASSATVTFGAGWSAGNPAWVTSAAAFQVALYAAAFAIDPASE